jgi:hypothetical protein|tara:strand:- start:593 stop:856 length:264 start_codon:yes stop_codon:yes gene_type:complete
MSKRGTPYVNNRNPDGTFKAPTYRLTKKQKYSRERCKRIVSHVSPSDHALLRQAADDIGVSLSDLIATVVLGYCRNSPDFPEIQQKP